MNEHAIKELIEENTEELIAEQIARAMEALGLESVDDFWGFGSCVEGICDKMESLVTINADLLEALKEIAKGEGAYSRDPLTHAGNVIVNMKGIATKVIHKHEETP